MQVPLIILLVVSFNESQEQDSAGVFKATLVGGTQVGTPTVENAFKKHYVFICVQKGQRLQPLLFCFVAFLFL